MKSRRMVLATIEGELENLGKQDGLVSLDRKLEDLRNELKALSLNVSANEDEIKELGNEAEECEKETDSKIKELYVDIEDLGKGHEETCKEMDAMGHSFEEMQVEFEEKIVETITPIETSQKQIEGKLGNLETSFSKTKEDFDALFKTLARSLKTHNSILQERPHVEVKPFDSSRIESDYKKLSDQMKDLEGKLDSLKLPKGKQEDWTIKTIRRNYDFRIKVSANDSREDFLTNKVVAGSGITVTELNDKGVRSLSISAITPTIDHGALTGLLDDDHTQYALLAGRSGGQTLYGGTASGDDFDLFSTSHATKGMINIGDTLHLDEANQKVIIGTTSPLFSAKIYTAHTHTGTGDYYGNFIGLVFDPTADNSAFVSAFSFINNTTGSKNHNAQLKGFDGILFHDGTGTLNQALGGNFIVKKNNTGPVTVMYGLNVSIGNFNATNGVVLGAGVQFATPTATGALTNTAGAYILNQGGSNITNSFGIYIDNQTGSATTNAAIYSVGGVCLFNGGQDAVSDFTIMGDTDASLFVADVSADLINVGKFKHNGSTLGFYGATPVAKSSAYTPSNVTTDRSYDANATTLDEVADVLGTLIADLQNVGLIG